MAFLIWYGARSLVAAWRGGGRLDAATGAGARLRPTLATLAAITWLNPHVWLDTVVFLGAVSAQYPGQGLAFWLGASAASMGFFLALAYGARALAPVFARPRAWQVLDGVIGLTMWAIAAKLALT